MNTIQDIGKVMATQDNRSTQFPLFAIMEDVRIWVNYMDDWDGKERAEDIDEGNLCLACKEQYDKTDEIPEDCLGEPYDGCDSDTFNYYKDDDKLTVSTVGVFFTAEACQAHIDENHYHYTNPRVYGIAAWRNPEMETVMQHLITEAGEKLPSHYE